MAVVRDPFTVAGRSGIQVKLLAEMLSYGFSQTEVNSSNRYGAAALPEGRDATKVMRRVFAVMRVWSVGQPAAELASVVGVYANFVMPEDENWLAKVEASALTELTRRSVTTSFGFASSHVAIDASQVVRRPASYSAQLRPLVLIRLRYILPNLLGMTEV